MKRTASRLAGRIRKSKEVLVAAHIDADGISAAGVASKALERVGIEHRARFFKSLDDDAISSIADENSELTWLVDFGSGEVNKLGGLNAVITDHHASPQAEVPLGKRTNLLEFLDSLGSQDAPGKENNTLTLNPHDFGKDGATDVSGAGVTYLVAKALDKKNTDLAALAVVGAVGDLQDVRHRKLVGTNETILEDGRKAGVVESLTDLRFFGRASRPLIKFLQFANDPAIPKLAENEDACTGFLNELGIDLLDGERWRSWCDLKQFERKLVISEIVKLILQTGYGSAKAETLIGDVYVLCEEDGMLSDAKEYSTLLNSCGRYEKADVGLKVCLGDRDKEFGKALKLLRGHREYLVNSLKYIRDIGIKELRSVQYFHAKDKVLDSVIGIIAGMILGSGDANRKLPIFGFANSSNEVKVSARSTKELVARGLNLSVVMRKASSMVGGVGGGHNIAAGATIPKGKEEEFIEHAQAIVREQLG